MDNGVLPETTEGDKPRTTAEILKQEAAETVPETAGTVQDAANQRKPAQEENTEASEAAETAETAGI